MHGQLPTKFMQLTILRNDILMRFPRDGSEASLPYREGLTTVGTHSEVVAMLPAGPD